MAPHQRHVLTLDVAARERIDQRRRTQPATRATTIRPLVSRSRRCTMPGRSRSPTSTISGYRFNKPVHQGAVFVPGTGMHDESDLLGDHDDVVVVVAHGERHVLGTGRRRFHGRAASPPPARLARACWLFATSTPSTVMPPTFGERLHLGAAPPVSIATTRSTRSPASASGISKTTRFTHGRSSHSWSRRSEADVSSDGSRNAATSNRIAPIVMAESATLNVGNRPTSTKSMTSPRKKPGSRDDSVDEIADRTTEHQRERHQHQRVVGPVQRADQDHRTARWPAAPATA